MSDNSAEQLAEQHSEHSEQHDPQTVQPAVQLAEQSTAPQSQTLTLSTIALLNSKPTFDHFRSTLYKQHGVKCNIYGPLILLSTVHAARKNLTDSYSQECNGLIIELASRRVICYPPRCLKTNHNSGLVGQYLKDGLYKIYRAELGTLVSFYYYEQQWFMSTSNSTNQRHARWSPEGRTYNAMINECLEATGVAAAPNLDALIATFDPQHCYTLGFKHPDIHKFHPEERRVWFVQKVCLDPAAPNYLFACDESPVADLPAQQIYTQQFTVRQLYYQAKMGLTDYIQTVQALDDQKTIEPNDDQKTIEPNDDQKADTANTANTAVPFYGYILRGSPTTCGDHSDLYVESSLSSAIRKIWYDSLLVQQRRTTALSHEAYVCLQQFLKDSDDFLTLFPQYATQFTAWNNKLAALAAYLAEGTAPENDPIVARTVQICKALAEANNPRPESIVDFTEFLRNIRFLDELSEYLGFDECNEQSERSADERLVADERPADEPHTT